MKRLPMWVIIILALLIVLGCKKEIRVPKDEQEIVNNEEIKFNEAKIMFNISRDFPEGAVRPDVVMMDGSPINEKDSVPVGKHKFTIKLQSYDDKELEIEVPGDKDTFTLNATLEAKKRVVVFDIKDKTTGKPIDSGKIKVNTSFSKDGKYQQEIISDRSSIKPGMKKIVIQCEGYKTISEDIEVMPDESFLKLSYEMEPSNK